MPRLAASAARPAGPTGLRPGLRRPRGRALPPVQRRGRHARRPGRPPARAARARRHPLGAAARPSSCSTTWSAAPGWSGCAWWPPSARRPRRSGTTSRRPCPTCAGSPACRRLVRRRPRPGRGAPLRRAGRRPRAAGRPRRRGRRAGRARPAATPSCSASCGASWSRPATAPDGRAPAARPAAPAALVSPEGVREVVAARLGRLPDDDRRPGPAGRSRRDRRSGPTCWPTACGCTVERRRGRPRARPCGPASCEESGPGEHRFVHALVRRAVVDDLPAARAAGAGTPTWPARWPGSTATGRSPRSPTTCSAAVPLVGGGRGGRRRPAGGRRGPAGPSPTTTPPACSRRCSRWFRPAGAAASCCWRWPTPACGPATWRRPRPGACRPPSWAGRSATARWSSTPPSPTTTPTGGRRSTAASPRTCCGPRCRWRTSRWPAVRVAGRPQPGAGAVGQGRRGRGARRARPSPRPGTLGVYRGASASPTRRRCSCRGRPTTSTASAARPASWSSWPSAEGDLEWELGAIDKLLFGTDHGRRPRRGPPAGRPPPRRSATGSASRCSGSSTSRPRPCWPWARAASSRPRRWPRRPTPWPGSCPATTPPAATGCSCSASAATRAGSTRPGRWWRPWPASTGSAPPGARR